MFSHRVVKKVQLFYVVDVKSVNSIYSGLMRDVRSLFELGFKILRLEDPGYLFIVGHYGDNST